MRRFPEEFLWGATTSSHPVEGGNFHNDWWAWEQRPGRIVDGATSRIAAAHAERYESDFALARKLGHNAQLVSLEWSRVCPAADGTDRGGIDHYRGVFSTLQRLGMTPVCGLQHVTVPQWLTGGWSNPASVTAFQTYADTVAEALGDYCSWWIAVLEPMFAATQQYLDGLWPPQTRSWRAAWQALRHIAEAHDYLYRRIHQAYPEHRVGLHIRPQRFEPFDENSAWDLRAARREEQRRTRSFIQGVRTGRWPRSSGFARTAPAEFDFIALAPSSRGVVQFDWRAAHRQWTRDATRGQDPATADELRAAIRALETYGRPLLIVGDGIATDDDAARRTFLLEHIDALQREVDAGVQVLGYFYRSLLDGFEWTRGYTARYGLVHVDWHSLARTPNLSAYLYKDIIEAGEIRPGTAARYGAG